MKIKKLNITSYGKFENREISFSDGLNIVCGKNESGKSSVMSFIRAMLYGFSGRGAVLANDRKHYLPWGKTSMQGSADILLDNGKTVKISRTSGKSQGFDKMECFDIANSESYDFSPENEVLCGEDAFLKTLCIKQLQTPISGEDDEISGKLINLTQTAAEDISTQKSEAIITDYIKKFKALRGEKGLIYDLQNQIADINERIADANNRRIECFDQIKHKNELTAKIAECKERLTFIKKALESVKQQEIFVKLDNIKAEKASLSEKLKVLLDERESLSMQLSSLSAFEKEAPEIIFSPTVETESIEKEIEKSKKSNAKSRTLSVFLIVAAALSAICFVIHPVALVLPVLLALAAALFFVKAGKTKKQLNISLSEFDKINSDNKKILDALSIFGVTDIKEYSEKKAVHSSLSTSLSTLKMQIAETEKELSAVENDESILKEKTASLTRIDTPYSVEELLEEEEALGILLQQSIAESSHIDGLLSSQLSLETADTLLSQRALLIKELDNAQCEMEAATLALQTLGKVFAEMRSDFTPTINKKASEYLARLTGGSIDKIYIDKKFSVNAETDSVKELAYFSLGTVDQTYLAIRLAIIDLLFGKDKPIFIDDAFLQYDSEREKAAFSLLSERAAEGQQIIFFTCRPAPELYEGANVISLDN